MLIQVESINNPLPPCPDTPNCERRSYEIDADSSILIEFAEKTLKNMGAESVKVDESKIHAVFRIPIFGWRDDVHVQISDGKLFIRSASRTGYSDLGVNKRRINRFVKKLNETISS